MNKKKGQSLVEVLVAMGIITMVFAGTATLIVQVVNLELSARSRTEAVALGQKYLAENVSSIKEGCLNNITTGVPETDNPNDKYTALNSCVLVNDDLSENTSTDCSPGEIDSSVTNFVKIITEVTWQDKGLPEETYTASEIVRIQE